MGDARRYVVQNEKTQIGFRAGLAGVGSAPTISTGLTDTPGNRVISLGWSRSSGAAAYNLSWPANFNGPFIPLDNSLAATSYLDTNAVSGQTNYYKLATANGCAVSASSAPVGVFLPRPAIFLIKAGPESLTISWPAWADDWTLYSATNLTPPLAWFPVTNGVGSNSGQFNVIIPINSGTHFFHLFAP